MTVKHSPECLKAQADVQAARAAYEQSWPNHCRSCDGWGFHRSPGDLVPYGSTWVSLPDNVDSCPDCLGVWKCPRCGTELDSDSENFVPCRNCGWVERDSLETSGGKPPEYECLQLYCEARQ